MPHGGPLSTRRGGRRASTQDKNTEEARNRIEWYLREHGRYPSWDDLTAIKEWRGEAGCTGSQR